MLTMGPGLRSPQDLCCASLHVEPWQHSSSGVLINDAERGQYSIYLLDLLLRSREQGYPARPIRYQIGFEWNPGETLPTRLPV